MAFPTQKDYLEIGFIKESSVPSRKKSDFIMKTYDSCTDNRAWSMENEIRAKYLLDIVKWIPNQKVGNSDGNNELIKYNKEQLDEMSTDDLIAHILLLYREKDNDRNSKKLYQESITKLDSNEEINYLHKKIHDLEIEIVTKNQENEMFKLREENVNVSNRINNISANNENIMPLSANDANIIENLRKEIESYKDLKVINEKLTIENNDLKVCIREQTNNVNIEHSRLLDDVIVERDILRGKIDEIENKSTIFNQKLNRIENERKILLDKIENDKLLKGSLLQIQNDQEEILEHMNNLKELEKIRNDNEKLNKKIIKIKDENKLLLKKLENYQERENEINLYKLSLANEEQKLENNKFMLSRVSMELKDKNEQLLQTKSYVMKLIEELKSKDELICSCNQRFKTLNNLEKEVKDVQEQLMLLMEETEFLGAVDQSINNLPNAIESVSYDERLEKQNDELKKEIELLRNTSNLDTKNNQLDENLKIDNYLLEINKLKKLLSEKEILTKELEVKIEQFKQNQNLLSIKQSSVNQSTQLSELIEKSNTISDSEQIIVLPNNQLEESKELLKESKYAIETLENQLKQLNDQIIMETNKSLHLQNTIVNNEKIINQLNQKIIDFENDVKILQNKNNEAEQIGKYKILEIEEFKENLAIVSVSNTQLTNDLAKMNEQLVNSQSNTNIMEQNFNELNQKIADKEIELNNLKQENILLKQKLDEFVMNQNELKNLVEKEQLKNKNSELNLKDLSGEHLNLQKQMKTLKKEFIDIENLINEIERQKLYNENLQLRFDEIHSEINKLKMPINPLAGELEITSSSNELEKLKFLLDKEIERNIELTDNIKELKADLVELHELKNVKNKFYKNQAKLELFEVTNNRKVSEIEHFNDEIQKISDERDKLQTEKNDILRELNNLETQLRKSKNKVLELQNIINLKSSNQLKQDKNLSEITVIKVADNNDDALKNIVDYQFKTLENKQFKRIKSLQSLHEIQINDLTVQHNMEIDFFTIQNEKLRISLTELHKKNIKKDKMTETENIDEIYLSKSKENRLENLCKQILKNGINTLDLNECIYLHDKVYDAAFQLEQKSKTNSSGMIFFPNSKINNIENKIIKLEQDLVQAEKLFEKIISMYYTREAEKGIQGSRLEIER